MKLGLIRHFKVDQRKKFFLSTDKFNRLMKEYDECPVIPNELTVNHSEWEVCYCSTLPRARKTAESVFNKKIIETDLLVEVPVNSFTDKNITLPLFLWHIGARVAWYKSHKSQLENISQTKRRIENFYEMIVDSGYKNILIVSHGYFLSIFYQEMKKKGFTGIIDINIKNGKLYTLTKQ